MAINRLGDIVKNAGKARDKAVAEQQAELRGEEFDEAAWGAEWEANNQEEPEGEEEKEGEGYPGEGEEKRREKMKENKILKRNRNPREKKVIVRETKMARVL